MKHFELNEILSEANNLAWEFHISDFNSSGTYGKWSILLPLYMTQYNRNTIFPYTTNHIVFA